jgi:hypothetical protein
MGLDLIVQGPPWSFHLHCLLLLLLHYGWRGGLSPHRSPQCQKHGDIGHGRQPHEVILNVEHVQALVEGRDFHPAGLPSF